ncbi:MAG: hypothetical protein L3J76_06065 [Candidatus Hydrothermae bacterium]|nr:hypothetical protein [Candidatus Hydrothermae bacterium]
MLLWVLWTGCAVPMMTPPPPLTVRSGWVGGGILQSDIYDLQVEAHVHTLDGPAYVEYTRGKERWKAAPGMLGLVIPISSARHPVLEVWGMPMVIRGLDGELQGGRPRHGWGPCWWGPGALLRFSRNGFVCMFPEGYGWDPLPGG